MKALRNVFYENLTSVLELIVDFVDSKFILDLTNLLTKPVEIAEKHLNQLGHVSHDLIVDEDDQKAKLMTGEFEKKQLKVVGFGEEQKVVGLDDEKVEQKVNF